MEGYTSVSLGLAATATIGQPANRVLSNVFWSLFVIWQNSSEFTDEELHTSDKAMTVTM